MKLIIHLSEGLFTGAYMEGPHVDGVTDPIELCVVDVDKHGAERTIATLYDVVPLTELTDDNFLGHPRTAADLAFQKQERVALNVDGVPCDEQGNPT